MYLYKIYIHYYNLFNTSSYKLLVPLKVDENRQYV